MAETLLSKLLLTLSFMICLCVGSAGALLVWKRTGNYDVDFFTKIIGWIMLIFSLFVIYALLKYIEII